MSKSFLVCCANGAGSSMMMKMALQKVLAENNINSTKIHHCPLSEAKSIASQFDVIFCSQNFVRFFVEEEKKGKSWWVGGIV